MARSAAKNQGVSRSIIGLILVVAALFVLFGIASTHFYPALPATKSTVTSTAGTTTSIAATTTIEYSASCSPLPDFACTNATLSQQNTLSLSIEQNITPVMYHVEIGCGSSAQASGARFTNETFNLNSGYPAQVNGLPCTGAHNGTFSGYIWINYTKLYTQPGYANPYYQNKVSSVTVPG